MSVNASEAASSRLSRTKTFLNSINSMKSSARRRNRRENWAPMTQAESSNSTPSSEGTATSGADIPLSHTFSFTLGDEISFSHAERSSSNETGFVPHARPGLKGPQESNGESEGFGLSSAASGDGHKLMATCLLDKGQPLDGVTELIDAITLIVDDPEAPETPATALQEYSGNTRKRRPSSAGDVDRPRPMLGNRARTTNAFARMPPAHPAQLTTFTAGSSQETEAGSTKVEPPRTASGSHQSSRPAVPDAQRQKEPEAPSLPAKSQEAADKGLLERCRQFVRRLPSQLVKGDRERMASELCAATKKDVTRNVTGTSKTASRTANRRVEGSGTSVSSMLELEPIGRPRSSLVSPTGNRPPRDGTRRVRWKVGDDNGQGEHPRASKRQRCQHFVHFFFKHIFSLGSLRRHKKGKGSRSNGDAPSNGNDDSNGKIDQDDQDAQTQPEHTGESPPTRNGPAVTAPVSRFQRWKRKWNEIRHRERGAWDSKVKQGESQREREKKGEAWLRQVRTIELRGRRRLRRRNRQQNHEANRFLTGVSGSIFSSASSGHPSTERAMFEAGPAPR